MQVLQTKQGIGYNPVSLILMLARAKHIWLFIPSGKDFYTAFANIFFCLLLTGLVWFSHLTNAINPLVNTGAMITIAVWLILVFKTWPRSFVKFRASEVTYADTWPKFKSLPWLLEWACFWVLLLSCLETYNSTLHYFALNLIRASILIALLLPLAGLSHQQLVKNGL